MSEDEYQRKLCRAWIHHQLSELYADQLMAIQGGETTNARKLKCEIVCWITALSLDDLIHGHKRLQETDRDAAAA